MNNERLYVLRWRLRDGQQRVWETHPTHLRLGDAQAKADDLWERGNETTIGAVGSEFDNLT